MAEQIGGQAKAAERQLVLAHLDINVHGDCHRCLALFGLMANDHRVIRNLDGRRRQLTHRDLALGHPYLTRHRQLVIDQADLQVRRHLQVRIGLDGDR
ncbi:hypothetical protein D9M73_186490 [compost metagenome]